MATSMKTENVYEREGDRRGNERTRRGSLAPEVKDDCKNCRGTVPRHGRSNSVDL